MLVSLTDCQYSVHDFCGNTNEYVPRWTTIRAFFLASGYGMMIAKKIKIFEKPAEFWESVIWSDETTVRSNPNSRDIFVKVHNTVKRNNLPSNTKSQNQGLSVASQNQNKDRAHWS